MNPELPSDVDKISGVLLVDKPAGITSFDVVSAVRRASGVRRVGHTGTLDPFATGLLPVCIGEATKIVQFLMDGSKEYVATVQLGAESDSGDPEGVVVQTGDPSQIGRADVERICSKFVGWITQVPPAHSAVRMNGVRMYALARAGIDVQPPERRVLVESIDILDWEPGFVKLRVRCGKGTYIRALARDMGRELGCFAMLSALRRTRVGALELENSVSIPELFAREKEGLALRCISVDNALAHLPAVRVDEVVARKVSAGQRISAAAFGEDFDANTHFCVVGPDGRVIAVAECRDQTIQVIRGIRPFVWREPIHGEGPETAGFASCLSEPATVAELGAGGENGAW